jgi:hypothetical protein
MNAKHSFFPEVGEVKLRFKSILSPEREKPFNMPSLCFELCRNSVLDCGWTQKLSSDSDLDPVLDFLMMSAAIAIRRVRKCPISRLCFPKEDLGTHCRTLNGRKKERLERAARRRLREKNLKADCTLLRGPLCRMTVATLPSRFTTKRNFEPQPIIKEVKNGTLPP